MDKSPDAFRTISEVADWLGTPTHVLRFWESRFTQVKPVKRAGGRRYYRPADMELLGGIKRLLHDDGMTIRGVQKLLREEGVRHVAALSQPLHSSANGAGDVINMTAPPAKEQEAADPAPMITDAPQADAGNVVPLSRTLAEAQDKDVGAPETEDPSQQAPTPPPEQEDQQSDKQDGSVAQPDLEEAEAIVAAVEEPEHQPEPEAEPEPPAQPELRPATIDLPADPEDDDATFAVNIVDVATLLRQAASAAAAERPAPSEIKPLYARLVALRERMTTDKRT